MKRFKGTESYLNTPGQREYVSNDNAAKNTKVQLMVLFVRNAMDAIEAKDYDLAATNVRLAAEYENKVFFTERLCEE